eukprot:TRINITY_DN31077_c0_g1_i2.p1 TRINITY_DN31077_c0_g1~~TRINITY_DN31077_c0_g1_i2.p1  ORF type:complete len:423 (+),score=71.61 TRINITY_DN31077_c0_g1_i2:51-1319(+)
MRSKLQSFAMRLCFLLFLASPAASYRVRAKENAGLVHSLESIEHDVSGSLNHLQQRVVDVSNMVRHYKLRRSDTHEIMNKIFFSLVAIVIFVCVCGPCIRGCLAARELKAKRESITFQYPSNTNRVAPSQLGDGMARLKQENSVFLKQKVNKLQTASAFIGYSAQTGNTYNCISTAGSGEELVLACREVVDVQALLGMNLAGALEAAGLNVAGAYADRSKAPFRMKIGMPATDVPTDQLPNADLMGLGMAANTDKPFLYLDRPFAFDCCCFNRPVVTVYDIGGVAPDKLGIICDPWSCLDMTFSIHMGCDASSSTPPSLLIRGAGCQPGSVCSCLGLCCARFKEIFLEVLDPKLENKTVAFITKGWAGGLKEIFTVADKFCVDFGEVTDPTLKAMLLSTALFLDYRFFEGESGETGGGIDFG